VPILGRHAPAWLRGTIIALGVLTVILSGVVIVDSAIDEGILATILALALLFVGIRNLVHGITGHHPVGTRLDTSVAAA
jgi:uncharacterized membrane protein HdeD (DUF308 family)